ncbi:hypothetical protein BDZ91DRAFT_755157 [Kalaharituber pfeilii]|nr:hypothetical protein BDZ91DRAFT_755157 [Kalaharituber pfeilii]
MEGECEVDSSQSNVERKYQHAKWVGRVDQLEQQMQHAQLAGRLDQLEQQMQHTKLVGRVEQLEQQTQHAKLAGRVEQLEQQMQRHQSGDNVQQLEEENRGLKDDLADERQQIEDLMKERDDALKARDAAVTRLDSIHMKLKYVRVGFANYEDLERLSSEDRIQLRTRLDLFAKSILRMKTEYEWGQKIPSGFRRLLEEFSIGNNDSTNNVYSKLLAMNAILSACSSSDEEASLTTIRNNRGYWCNQHQNSLLVVEALVTLQELRAWLG